MYANLIVAVVISLVLTVDGQLESHVDFIMPMPGYPYPGPQNPTTRDVFAKEFLVTECKWNDIIAGKRRYDLVIVGSGPCGYAAASRALSNNPHTRVLMIERGDYFLAEHFQNLSPAYGQTMNNGLMRTYPWTLTDDTYSGRLGGLRMQIGQAPFLGGRSTIWSAFCPRPTKREMVNWPNATIERLSSRYFDAAEELLHVQSADRVGREPTPQPISASAACNGSSTLRSLYAGLQIKVGQLLVGANSKIATVDRVEPAHIASSARTTKNIDFEKFSTPTPLLDLVMSQRLKHSVDAGAEFDIVCNCVVERILHQNGKAVALKTSRGDLRLFGAKLILAGGTIPITTLVRNSFPDMPSMSSRRFMAHFGTGITVRVPLYDDLDANLLDVSAHYLTGWSNSGKQYQIELCGHHDPSPTSNAGVRFRYMPNAVATASPQQLASSAGYAIFVGGACGEMNPDNEHGWIRKNDADPDPTTNSLLQIQSNSREEVEIWDTMDNATFDVLDLLRNGPNGTIEYWTATSPDGSQWGWSQRKPTEGERRWPVAFHESSTLHIGEEADAPVDLDYKLRGTENVYITGGALLPTNGAWNPTMTMVAMAIDLVDRLPVTQQHN